MDKKKVVITGGHLTPALAVIPKLMEKGYEIHFVGRLNSMEGDNSDSEEFKEIKKLGIPFYKINTGRLQRTFTGHTLKSLLKIPLGIYQSYKLIKNIRPDCVLSFGGYIALPICVSAKIQKVPIVTHEQTITSGLANNIISKIADLILVSFKESLSSFPPKKTILVGNPLRSEVFKSDIKLLPASLAKNGGKFHIIYFTGGNQGAHALNEAIKKILPELLRKYIIVHQTGSGKNLDDYNNLNRERNELPENLRERYLLFSYISSHLIGTILKYSDLIVGRSGANTVSEAFALKKTALFIPLPSSAGNEQYKNALRLKNFGVAQILDQKYISEKLLMTIESMLDNIEDYNKRYRSLKNEYNVKTPEIIASSVERVINAKKKNREKTSN